MDPIELNKNNSSTKEIESSLIYAIRNKYKNIVNLLMKYRKDMINIFYMGETPLMLACKYLDANTVNNLINNGAKIDEIDMCEKNALYYAICNKYHKVEVIISLIDNGIYIDKKMMEYLEKLDSLRLKTILAFRKNGINGMRKFLNTLDEQNEKNTQANQNNKIRCFIYLMVSHFFEKTINEVKFEFRELLRENSNVIHEMIKGCKKRENTDKEKCKTYSLKLDMMMELIYNFCALGNFDIVKSMIDIGVNINKEYKNGETLLMTAIKEKNTTAIECLLKSGADINIKTSINKGIMHYAMYNGDIKTVNCLQNYINSNNNKVTKKKISIIHNFERIKNNQDIKMYLV